MLMVLIDAVVLMGLLLAFQEEEHSMGGVAALAIVTAIVRGILVYAFVVAMGLPGLYLGLLIAAVLLGVSLSALYGMELKRAVMVAGIFMVAHLVIGYGLNSMMNRAAQVALDMPPELLLI